MQGRGIKETSLFKQHFRNITRTSVRAKLTENDLTDYENT